MMASHTRGHRPQRNRTDHRLGNRSTACARHSEGIVGRRRPCTQFRMVPTLTPKASANSVCESPSEARS